MPLPLTIWQCWHAMVRHHSEHCVLANEHEFILIVRSGNCLQLSKSYLCQPSTPEETREMMMHLSYFLALGLCKRYPFNDIDVKAAALPQEIATSNTASSPPASTAKQGTSRTHAKTDSQATIRGPVNTAMMVRCSVDVTR